MMFLERFTAAFYAFKDPWLVGEARSTRQILESMWLRADVVLLEAERHGRLLVPIFHSLPHDMQRELRRHAGGTYEPIRPRRWLNFSGFWERVWNR